MKTEIKIYAALVVLAGLGAGVYFTNRTAKAEREQRSVSTSKSDLPTISVPKDDADKITKIELSHKGDEKDDKAARVTVTLEKKGDEWSITQPTAAKATATDVKSLVDNLKDLKTTEAIDHSAAHYAEYDLDDAKAVHVVAYKGSDKVVDLYFGKSGTRGQLVRVAGKDGVFIATGYQGFLYSKDAKGFRDKTILKLKDDEVKDASQVTVDNVNGDFDFTKKDGKWTAQFSKLGKDGKADKPDEKWEKFDGDKVEDLLKAFKALNAVDFADANAKPEDTGLADPQAQGGIIKVKLKDKEVVFKVGKTQKGKNRFAVKDGDPTVYVISSWSGDWATADKAKFEKKDDKKKPEGPPPGGDDDGPGGMQLPPGMDMPGGD